MDYYQGVVVEYLRANRSIFVNTEYCIQTGNYESNPDKNAHWYCDAVAINPKKKEAYLCEISYARYLSALLKRIEAWDEHWNEILAALDYYSAIAADWTVEVKLFVPNHTKELLENRLHQIEKAKNRQLHFRYRIIDLEEVQPWKYPSWNRKDEGQC